MVRVFNTMYLQFVTVAEFLWPAHVLDVLIGQVSKNNLAALPAEISALVSLQELNVEGWSLAGDCNGWSSHSTAACADNQIVQLPEQLGGLKVSASCVRMSAQCMLPVPYCIQPGSSSAGTGRQSADIASARPSQGMRCDWCSRVVVLVRRSFTAVAQRTWLCCGCWLQDTRVARIRFERTPLYGL